MLRSGSLWKKHGRSSAGLLYMGPQHGKIPSNTPHFALDWMEWLEPFWQNYHAEVLAVRSTLLESEEEASKDRSWALCAPFTLFQQNGLSECCCSDLSCGICLWVGICCPWATEFTFAACEGFSDTCGTVGPFEERGLPMPSHACYAARVLWDHARP